MLRIFYFLDR